MNNLYNSPAEQMKRLRAAGLNPNLVYGTGAATSSVAPVRGADKKLPRNDAPQVDMNSPILNANQVGLVEAQTDNVKATTEATKMNILNAAADLKLKGTQGERSQFDLDQAKRLADLTIEKYAADLGQTKANTKYTLDSNERAAAMQGYNIKESVQKVLNLRNQNMGQDLENQLKQLDINLKKVGIQPGDPAYMRILQQVLSGEVPKGLQKIGEFLDKNTPGLWKPWK
jgi:hypothetical protein